MLLLNRAVTRFIPQLSLLTALCLAVPLVQAANPGDRFKDWTVGCDKLPGTTQERCFIYQTVATKDKDQPVLQMSVGYLPGEDGKDSPAAFLTLPLGIALPPGIGFKVDDGKIARIQFERCIPTGCVAGFPLDDPSLVQFKKGAKMEVRFHDGVGIVAVPISLSGFTAGFDALK
jgi:invasion protein IalB